MKGCVVTCSFFGRAYTEPHIECCHPKGGLGCSLGRKGILYSATREGFGVGLSREKKEHPCLQGPVLHKA